MHYFSQNFTYEHNWAQVNVGLGYKYPNPQCSHVVSIDVVGRSIDADTGIIRTERLLGCKQKAPIWIVKLLGGSEDAFVREVSFVDPSTQTTSVHSANLSLSQYVTCLERIHYTPHPSAPDTQTLFTQTAEVQTRMPLWRNLSDKLESWMTERFGQNAQLGRMGFEGVLDRLWTRENKSSQS